MSIKSYFSLFRKNKKIFNSPHKNIYCCRLYFRSKISGFSIVIAGQYVLILEKGKFVDSQKYLERGDDTVVAREKLYRLKKRSRPLKQVKVKREQYMEKLSETYFSHLGFKSWEETEKGRPPMRAGSTAPLDFWFSRFSKNIGRIGSHRAPEAGVLAQGGPSAELLRKRYRRHAFALSTIS